MILVRTSSHFSTLWLFEISVKILKKKIPLRLELTAEPPAFFSCFNFFF
jgi:hypothetical protein